MKGDAHEKLTQNYSPKTKNKKKTGNAATFPVVT